jgi:hypothetical protein
MGALLPAKRPRRVVLTPVVVDAIDNALDVVLAHATIVVAARPKTRAGVDHQVPERVVLRRSAWVCELTPAQRGETLPRAPGEREVGDEVVDSSEIIAPLNHILTITSHSSIRSHDASTHLTPSPRGSEKSHHQMRPEECRDGASRAPRTAFVSLSSTAASDDRMKTVACEFGKRRHNR